MKRWVFITAATGGLLGAVTWAAPAAATNGYFAHAYGPVAKGMAGATAAFGQSVLAATNNPATTVQVGNKAGFCWSSFLPNRSVEVGANTLSPLPQALAGTYDSDNSIFNQVCGGANWELNPNQSVGFSMYAQGGMNTQYPTNGGPGLFGAGEAGVDLGQMFFSVNYGHRLTDKLAVGVSPVLAVQRFSAQGLTAFQALSADPTHVTNNGREYSYGGGLKVGALYNATDTLTLGAAYTSRMYMSAFSDYAGLFAEQGDFDIPPSVTVGTSWAPQPGWRLNLDWQRIFYSDVSALSNRGTTGALMGTNNGAGFGWKDMDVFKLGTQYEVNDRLTLRGGVSYATDFTDGDEVLFNTLAPATVKWHASVGANIKLRDNVSLVLAYTRAFPESFNGTTAAGQDITLKMDQHEITAGLGFTF